MSRLDEAFNCNEKFWKTWKTIGNFKTKKQNLSNPDGKRWENFFTNLYRKHSNGNIDEILAKIPQEVNENLNKKITMEECLLTVKQLKNNKAVGPDRIPNEFIKNAPTEILELILEFLNLNLKKGLAASNWCLDFISPIHKEGPLDDPDNYRGLVIMNALLKNSCVAF